MTSSVTRPTRRTLVKGAAWSVPVVAVAGAAPAFAASQEVWFENLQSACKLPGASCEKDRGVTKGYAIALRLCSNVRSDVLISFADATVSLGGAPATTGWDVQPDPLPINYDETLPVPQCDVVVISVEGEPNSANVSISGVIPFTWTSSSGLSGSGIVNFSAASTPPCENCTPAAAL
ncbi:hypothetical protein [Ornithinimicrobium tianjinense]|uniref:SipW-cognate class signal peptide n=1 Tax=Ornithinimicrobium tianjinense TaxID=1195761 RepID=A0A917F3D2_9MICO|nr:hypothetical protein [Ornithinimicrobium tianjinense]GGF45043.1 hypothetical protein GCM10011366_10940 [Ornithinimicrobium tianjinense]